MLKDTLREIFIRDLEKLKHEISLYSDEKNLWIVDKMISNCAGNLCLHLIGNLNTFIGGQFGNTGYVRQRELEFSLKDVERVELIKKIEDTLAIVDTSLANLSQSQMDSEYPLLIFEKKTTTQYFLLHLSTHLSYHLGQINYHRRMFDA